MIGVGVALTLFAVAVIWLRDHERRLGAIEKRLGTPEPEPHPWEYKR